MSSSEKAPFMTTDQLQGVTYIWLKPVRTVFNLKNNYRLCQKQADIDDNMYSSPTTIRYY